MRNWLRLTGIGLCLVALSSTAVVSGQDDSKPQQDSASQTKTESSAKPKREPIYDESADPEQQIAAALKKAGQENQRVIIQWGANWCGWCYLLHDIMEQDPEISRKLMYDYQVVLVDVGQFDKHPELLKKYEADIKGNGVPFLTVLNPDGSVVVNQETSSLESSDEDKRGHDREAVLTFLDKNAPEPVAAEQVLARGIQKAQESDRLVFLHFGAPWCGWCHYLEDWMAEPEQAVMHRQFVDVKVDIDRMNGGPELLEKYREQSGGIPWFAVIDPKSGDVVIDSTGPEGNVGFPSTDNEIAYFGEILEKCGDRFSEQEISLLKESLVRNRKQREAARAARLKEQQAAKAAQDDASNSSEGDKDDN